MNEDSFFKMLSVVIFAIALAFVLLTHRWSIEELHRRVTQLESRVSNLKPIEKVTQ